MVRAQIPCGRLAALDLSAAADALVDEARALAAEALEATPADIPHRAGIFKVAGTDRRITLAEIARRPGSGLSAYAEFQPEAATFPRGRHIAEVEIDPETGVVTFVDYTAVEDAGTVMNPALV